MVAIRLDAKHKFEEDKSESAMIAST